MTVKQGDIFKENGKLYKVMWVFRDGSMHVSEDLTEQPPEDTRLTVDDEEWPEFEEHWSNREFDSDYEPWTTSMPAYEGQSGANGMKYDNGKLLAAIPFQDFPRALKAVAEISTYGAKKYKRSSWQTVPDANIRYTDAGARHFLEYNIHGRESVDEESKLLHTAHHAWNVLALLELDLIEKEKNGK